MIKYHLFRSKNYPDRAISIGEREDGSYFIQNVSKSINPEFNSFDTIEEIEVILDDKLSLIMKKNQIN